MVDPQLQSLLDFVKNTDLQELVWEKNGTRIRFKRSEGVVLRPAQQAEPSAPEAPLGMAEPLYIRSTMVGTFYRSDLPDRPPWVVVGTEVASGQPVASIEAMKIRKDVVAPMPCRIVQALVENGHSVEYGQPLFEVEVADNGV